MYSNVDFSALKVKGDYEIRDMAKNLDRDSKVVRELKAPGVVRGLHWPASWRGAIRLKSSWI